MEGNETTKISAVNNVGYYDFTVKNYNDINISDVSQNYYIEIISNTDESIEFELLQDGKALNLNNKKTDNIFIEGIEAKQHDYRLKIVYDSSKSFAENDILEDVQIKVHSEQAKI